MTPQRPNFQLIFKRKMFNSGKKKENGNEAGLGMHQAGEQLPLALPLLAFTESPRKDLSPSAPPTRLPCPPQQLGDTQNCQSQLSPPGHQSSSSQTSILPPKYPHPKQWGAGCRGGSGPARVRVQESVGPQLYQQSTDQREGKKYKHLQPCVPGIYSEFLTRGRSLGFMPN